MQAVVSNRQNYHGELIHLLLLWVAPVCNEFLHVPFALVASPAPHLWCVQVHCVERLLEFRHCLRLVALEDDELSAIGPLLQLQEGCICQVWCLELQQASRVEHVHHLGWIVVEPGGDI